jgi:hypothetical protein
MEMIKRQMDRLDARHIEMPEPEEEPVQEIGSPMIAPFYPSS